MKIWDIALLSVEGLRERKFRVTLNLVGILIGCTAITGLVSITQGLNEEISVQLERFGPNNLMIIPGELSLGAGLISQSFSWRDYETIKRISGVDVASPIVGNKICRYQKNGQTFYAYVYGVETEYFEINNGWKVEEGRNIKRGDNAVAVIGADVAHPKDLDEPLFEVGDRITAKVKVEGEEKEITLRVIGIMGKMGGTFGSDEDSSMFIPFRVCQQLYELGGEFQFIAARVNEIDKIPRVISEIEDSFAGTVTVMSAESMQEMIGNILGAVEAALGGIAAISLVVAGVGIINTMTISVMERTREIGILKAVGAKSRDILLMFIIEASVTGLSGGVMGVLVGFMLGNIIGKYINLPVSYSVSLAVGVVAFAVVTSSLSGLYPAWRASNLDPVEALRAE